MKKIVLTMMSLCIFITAFAGCGGKSGEKEYDVDTLSAEIVASSAFSDILSQVKPDIAPTFYGFDAADVESMSLYCSTGATTEEVGIFKCKDADAASRVLEKAKERVSFQKTSYESYAPAEVPKLNDAIVKADGVYVFYIVASDYSPVKSILK